MPNRFYELEPVELELASKAFGEVLNILKAESQSLDQKLLEKELADCILEELNNGEMDQAMLVKHCVLRMRLWLRAR